MAQMIDEALGSESTEFRGAHELGFGRGGRAWGHPWDHHDGAGRWFAELPLNHDFQANFIADFYENELISFPQWLVWFRRWLWAVERRLNWDEDRLKALEDRQVVDSESIHRDPVSGWGTITQVFNPDLNIYETQSANEEIKLHVITSTQELSQTIKGDDAVFTFDAPNATVVLNDGVYTPDLTAALDELLRRASLLGKRQLKETATVKPTGTWSDTVLQIGNNVKISNSGDNSIVANTDGLYSKDLSQELGDVTNRVSNLENKSQPAGTTTTYKRLIYSGTPANLGITTEPVAPGEQLHIKGGYAASDGNYGFEFDFTLAGYGINGISAVLGLGRDTGVNLRDLVNHFTFTDNVHWVTAGYECAMPSGAMNNIVFNVDTIWKYVTVTA